MPKLPPSFDLTILLIIQGKLKTIIDLLDDMTAKFIRPKSIVNVIQTLVEGKKQPNAQDQRREGGYCDQAMFLAPSTGS